MINITKEFLAAKNKKERENLMNFTEPSKLIIDNSEYNTSKWFEVRTITIETILKNGNDNIINLFAGIKKGNYGPWEYYEDLNISIHRYGAAQTCFEAIKQVNEFEMNFLVEFFWNKNGLHPNNKGLIEISN